LTRPPTLIGDGIENPWNARTMHHAAAMFGGDCRFRDRAKLAAAWQDAGLGGSLAFATPEAAARSYRPIIAFDTYDDAESIYGLRMPRGDAPAIIVGNERRGIAHDMRAIAGHAVQIPVISRTLTSLNVAAASAVALYYLGRGGGRAMHISREAQRRRPELLLIGGADHWELGSTIRSAGAFGWQRVLVEDRHGVWFGADRVTRSEGRAAARRARNPMHLIPTAPTDRLAFERVIVVTRQQRGIPLHKANLAGGPRTVIALPDERETDAAQEEWQRLGSRIEFVHLEIPATNYVYHYRLLATIALAESARQAGQPATTKPRAARRTPSYDFALTLRDAERGEIVSLEDLECY
jgi:tRNA(Leu) C34 or U34 (ribose-2'-O)-methylase TrmL